MSALQCRICGNTAGNALRSVREMMFGTREVFDYSECAVCGCLQIAETPPDLSRHYPRDYYSFAAARGESTFKQFLQRRRAEHVLGRKSLIGGLIEKRYGVPPTLEYARRAQVGFEDAVLEVGCGTGERLRAMRGYGFADLTGLDPFVERPVDHPGGVRVFKKHLLDHEGKYDFVMLHHTFEHMDDPYAVLGRVRDLLGEGRFLLLRIPVASSHAFRTYGADWVQLDAPRHLCLHTRKSIGLLASRCGFEVREVVYDSSAFQFWGSEQYRQDIPLRDERSYAVNPGRSMFAPDEIEAFEKRARELNRTGDGDQACFYLRKT